MYREKELKRFGEHAFMTIKARFGEHAFMTIKARFEEDEVP